MHRRKFGKIIARARRDPAYKAAFDRQPGRRVEG
jgi:hypothetical protein